MSRGTATRAPTRPQNSKERIIRMVLSLFAAERVFPVYAISVGQFQRALRRRASGPGSGPVPPPTPGPVGSGRRTWPLTVDGETPDPRRMRLRSTALRLAFGSHFVMGAALSLALSI